MSQQVCPRCEQDYIYKVRIIALDKIVYLCEECDALWELESPISKASFMDFGNYMEKYGYTGDWSLVERGNINSGQLGD